MNRPGPALAAGLLAAAAALAGCAPATGQINGFLGYTGGPPRSEPTAVAPLSGTVVISRDGIAVAHVRADGPFTARLVPGIYRLAEARLGCATTVTVRAGETVPARLVCSIK